MEASAHEQFAELEDRHFWFRARRDLFRRVLEHHLAAPAEARGARELRVLEIGCGTGGLLPMLQGLGRTVGLEVSVPVSRLARDRSGRPVFCGDAYRLPFRGGELDLVCLFDVLEHIEDEARALAELFRVMRPGGTALFSVPAYPFLYANNDRVVHHHRRYTRPALRRVLVKAGFEPVHLSYFNSLLLPAIVPTILMGKLKERLVGLRDPKHTNLSTPIPRPLNELLYRVMRSEGLWLPRVEVPAGHSLIALVRSPREGSPGAVPSP